MRFQRQMSLNGFLEVDHRWMVIDMDMTRLDTVEQVREFLSGVSGMEIQMLADSAERLRFVESTLRRFVR
ncbi:MAG: hypothetical protein LBE32_04580 [Burkholderiales bacterium]|nr:hypothetical protein [Burkholderiales bacterium]